MNKLPLISMKTLLALLLLAAFPSFAQTDSLIAKPSGSSLEVPDAMGLQVKPVYPGGMEAFYRYVGQNFRVPKVKGVTSVKIYAYFIIEADGSMSNIKVLRDPGYGLAEETERVLKGCPEKWTPGVSNGQKVRCGYNLPITINIK